ncbi:MarR family transcriptional regulator [Streptomyces sp. ODS28]|uniref:MarR family winged helix-turn-helix transcriptional regulator n=1 Tax=Streptomyces sp. ODS28 TaxID=3136688 RepID=UPI0031F0154B
MRESGNTKAGNPRSGNPKAETAPAPEEPGTEEPGIEELAQAADRLFYAMRRSRSAAAGKTAAALSMSQLALLAPLTGQPAESGDSGSAEADAGEGLPVGRLAAGAEVSVPTATRMLNQLEGRGLVTRRRSPHDERRVLVRLTEQGAEDLAAMQDELRTRQYAALSQFTPEEREVLTAQLHRLAGLIGETVPGAAPRE